jgi:hypothetical protein
MVFQLNDQPFGMPLSLLKNDTWLPRWSDISEGAGPGHGPYMLGGVDDEERKFRPGGGEIAKMVGDVDEFGMIIMVAVNGV